MNPIAIPVAMLYVSGMATIVKKAGTAISNRSHAIFFNDEDIKIPTMTKAGVVTSEVTTLNSGEKNNARMKNPAATTAVNPERPPAPTPAVDSIYDVVVDVPNIDPVTVAAESANNAFPARGNLLFFIKPACVATATSVPAVSKKSTNKNVKMTRSICVVNKSPKCANAWPNVGAMLGTSPTTPDGGSMIPTLTPTTAVRTIP